MRQIGHDVELFIEDQDNNQIVPSNQVLELLWDRRPQISINYNNKTIPVDLHSDNVMLELNPTPVETSKFKIISELTLDSLRHHIQYTSNQLGKNWDISYTHTRQAQHCVDDPKFTEFNCRPSYNIYTGKINKTSVTRLGNYRIAGGHIHFESNDPEEIKIMDMLLGLPETILRFPELVLRKRIGYGRPGNYRVRENPYNNDYKYILEYRVLSNNWFYNMQTKRTIQDMIEILHYNDIKDLLYKYVVSREQQIFQAIDEVDIPLGFTLVHELRNILCKQTPHNDFQLSDFSSPRSLWGIIAIILYER